jgi:hypothetical protein
MPRGDEGRSLLAEILGGCPPWLPISLRSARAASQRPKALTCRSQAIVAPAHCAPLVPVPDGRCLGRGLSAAIIAAPIFAAWLGSSAWEQGIAAPLRLSVLGWVVVHDVPVRVEGVTYPAALGAGRDPLHPAVARRPLGWPDQRDRQHPILGDLGRRDGWPIRQCASGSRPGW